MDAQRLCVGVPRDEGGERHWDLWTNLTPNFASAADAKLFKGVFQSRHERPERSVLAALLTEAVLAVRKLWTEIAGELAMSDELDRFLTVEVPVHSIFAYRQYAGICINRTLALDLIREISEEKYEAYGRVASTIQKSPTGLNYWNVGEHLSNTDVAHLSDIEDGGRLREAFKLAAFHSEFARTFLTYVDATRDETIVRHATGSRDRIHPVFRSMGTVTGRILVADPYLQQLRRKWRGIVSPESDHKLVYLDYSQFEPGIVAFLSQDVGLIEAYNDGDVYVALSERVFGSPDYRSLSKKIYLAFCYGMSPEGIARLISGVRADGSELEAFRDAITGFFEAFPGLNRLRVESKSALAASGHVSSLLGNRRYRTSKGSLNAKEQRWALNQRVQATASLIFKEALIALAEVFDRRAILLPVHDAVLMQLECRDDFQSKVDVATKIMENQFVARCPGIRARVIAGPFSPNE